MKAIFLVTAFALVLSTSGISQAETADNQQNTSTIQPLTVGSSLRLASVCLADGIKIKIYVTEDFLHGPSLVLLNLALTNDALGIDVMTAVTGDLTINDSNESFEYVLTYEQEDVARLKLVGEEGVPSRFTGNISIEGWEAVCQ